MNDETKGTLKQLAFHLRGLADAIEQLDGEKAAELPVANPALDDVVPWHKYPARVRRIGDEISERSGLRRLQIVGSFSKLLTYGRQQICDMRGVGETTIKTLDDEFAARNCPEWLTS